MSRKSISFWLLFLPDTILLYVALWISMVIRYPAGLPRESLVDHVQVFSGVFLIWLIVLFIHGLFELYTLRRYTLLVFNLVSAMAINILAAITYFYTQPLFSLTPRRFLLIDVAISFALILLWHLLVKYFVKNRMRMGVYLFSFHNELRELEQEIGNHNYAGFYVLGHVNQQTLLVHEFKKDSIIILPEGIQAKPEIIEQFYRLRREGVTFFDHKQFYENLLRRVYLSQLNELWFLENINYKEKRFYNLVKRIIDIAAGIVLGIITVVTFPLIATLVKLSAPGPVFFINGRLGKNGKIFQVYKYRTMNVTEQGIWTAKEDKRITKIGKILRKTRIDEWPQFLNLIIGNMSLVGPRPEQPAIVEDLKKQIPFYDERHVVKPGLTGWAQLNIYAGSVEETKLKLQYDLYYIKYRSFLFDLEIILKTIYVILAWRGK